jgi:uroporphyrinogen decarboxylase
VTAPILTQAKSLIRALHGEVQARPAFWFMRQAGRYLPEYRAIRAKAPDFVSLCLNPELATEITLQPVRRFAMDAAILFSDILMVPHALGQKLEFKEGEGPVLEPIRTGDDLLKLHRQYARDFPGERLAPVFETVRRVAKELPLDTALIGFAGAPWTVATYMVEGRGKTDFSTVRKMALAEPALFDDLIDLLVDSTALYLNAQIEAGAEAVQIFDTWAGVLPDAEFQRWAVEPVREIVNKVQMRHPAVPIIAFPKGAGLHLQDYAERTGVECLAIDATIPPEWAATHLLPQSTVQGNLDPLALVIGGKTMENAVNRILKALGRGPFVFNLGHGIVPETPPEHVARLSEMIRAWHHRHA